MNQEEQLKLFDMVYAHENDKLKLYHDLNIGKWPKEFGEPEQVTKELNLDGRRWRLMQLIENLIGNKYILFVLNTKIRKQTAKHRSEYMSEDEFEVWCDSKRNFR
jgi:hypothetical protein